jgi:hypothetical protein
MLLCNHPKQETNTMTIQINENVPIEHNEPPVTERAISHVQAALAGFGGELVLQARMYAFDAIHGTEYRQIRNGLVELKKRKEFESKIGLIASGR